MRKFIFGAKSDVPADTRLSNGYTLFDWAVRKNGFPEFFARNISGENALTKEEMSFLAKKNCKILFVFNDVTELEVAGNDGTNSAMRAVAAMRNLEVPEDEKIAVIAEIKDDWIVNRNWMYTFAKEVEKSGFYYGFIGNTDSSDNFSFDKECSHYGIIGISPVLCATKPENYDEITTWKPYAPSAYIPEDIQLWQTGEVGLNGISYKVVYARDESILDCMYNIEEGVSVNECEDI